MTRVENSELDEDPQDWDLDERDKWLEENDSDDFEDPTEVAVEADE